MKIKAKKSKGPHGFSKRSGRKTGKLITSSTPARVLGGYDEKTGATLSEGTVRGMVSTLSQIISTMATAQLGEL